MDKSKLKELALAATPGPWVDNRNLGWKFPQTQVEATDISRKVAVLRNDELDVSCTIGKVEREYANAAYIAAANPSTVLELLAEIERLESENDKVRASLGDTVTAATMLHELSVQDGGINARFSGGAAQLLAEAFGEQFTNSGATNYLEVGFNTSAGLRLLVTLQRCDGKTPATLQREAEAKLAELESAPSVDLSGLTRHEGILWTAITRLERIDHATSEERIAAANGLRSILATKAEQPAAGLVPEGWKIDEVDGELRIKQDGCTGIVPRRRSDNDAENILYALASDLLAARPVPPVPAPAEQLEAQIIQQRIAITPEYEGGFMAEKFGDEEAPTAKGCGWTPSEAIAAMKPVAPAPQPTTSVPRVASIDTLEFRVLLSDVCASYNSGLSVAKRERSLIAHIDANIAHHRQTSQTTQGMADCMDMVRQELIEAGIIDKSVPPMMIANAVVAHIARQDQAGAVTWKPLSDSQWVNIVNHDHAYENYDKEGAVHEAVKRTEAKLKELNAAPTLASAPQADDYKLRALCAEMVKLHKDRGTVLTIHMEALEDILAAPIAQEGEQSADLTTVDCPICNGHGLVGGRTGQTPESYEEVTMGCDECDGQGKIIVSRKDLAAITAPSSTDASAQAAPLQGESDGE